MDIKTKKHIIKILKESIEEDKKNLDLIGTPENSSVKQNLINWKTRIKSNLKKSRLALKELKGGLENEKSKKSI